MKAPTPLAAYVSHREHLDYLARAVAFLVAEATTNRINWRHLMATVAELQAALEQNTAATTAAVAAISAEIVQLAAAIAALTPGDPVTQAQLDQLNASSSALEAATAALVADDAPAA